MKTNKQRSELAFRAVLAHASFASLDSKNTSSCIAELLKGLRVLCDEYNVDFDKDSQLNSCPHCSKNLNESYSVIREYVNKSSDSEEDDRSVFAYGHYGLDQEFVSDSFEGFGDGSYDLLDNSDKCESCNGQL